VSGCCECGDEPSGSCATELVSYNKLIKVLRRNLYVTAELVWVRAHLKNSIF
jgi:hypothetical protein